MSTDLSLLNPGTSIQLDSAALQHQEEDEYHKDEAEKQQELRELLSQEFGEDDDILSLSGSSRDGGLSTRENSQIEHEDHGLMPLRANAPAFHPTDSYSHDSDPQYAYDAEDGNNQRWSQQHINYGYDQTQGNPSANYNGYSTDPNYTNQRGVGYEQAAAYNGVYNGYDGDAADGTSKNFQYGTQQLNGYHAEYQYGDINSTEQIQQYDNTDYYYEIGVNRTGGIPANRVSGDCDATPQENYNLSEGMYNPLEYTATATPTCESGQPMSNEFRFSHNQQHQQQQPNGNNSLAFKTPKPAANYPEDYQVKYHVEPQTVATLDDDGGAGAGGGIRSVSPAQMPAMTAYNEKGDDNLIQLQVLHQARGRKLEEVTESYEAHQTDSAREIRILKHKLSVAEGEKEGAGNSLRQCQVLYQECQETKVKLEAKLQGSDAQSSALILSKDELLKQLQSAEAQIENLTEQLNELSCSESLSRAKNQHQAVVTSMQQKHEREVFVLKEQLDMARNRFQDKENEVCSVKNQLQSCQKCLEDAQISRADTINKLTQKLDESQRQCQSLLESSQAQEVAQLKMHLQQSTMAKNMSNELCHTLQNELSEVKEQLNMFETASSLGVFAPRGHSTKTTSVSNADDSMFDLGIKKTLDFQTPESIEKSQSSTQLEGLTSSLKAELERALLQNSDKRKKVYQLQGELEKAEEEIKLLTARCERAEKSNEELKVKLKEYEDLCNVSGSRINPVEARLKKDIDNLHREREALLNDAEDLKQRLEEITSSEDKLTEINQQLKKQISQMVREYDEDKRVAINKCQEACLAMHEDSKEKMRNELYHEFDTENAATVGKYEAQLNEAKSSLNAALQEIDNVKDMYVKVCHEKDLLEEHNQTFDIRLQAETEKIKLELANQTEVTTPEDEIKMAVSKAKEDWRREQEEEMKQKIDTEEFDKLQSEKNQLKEQLNIAEESWEKEKERIISEKDAEKQGCIDEVREHGEQEYNLLLAEHQVTVAERAEFQATMSELKAANSQLANQKTVDGSIDYAEQNPVSAEVCTPLKLTPVETISTGMNTSPIGMETVSIGVNTSQSVETTSSAVNTSLTLQKATVILENQCKDAEEEIGHCKNELQAAEAKIKYLDKKYKLREKDFLEQMDEREQYTEYWKNFSKDLTQQLAALRDTKDSVLQRIDSDKLRHKKKLEEYSELVKASHEHNVELAKRVKELENDLLAASTATDSLHCSLEESEKSHNSIIDDLHSKNCDLDIHVKKLQMVLGEREKGRSEEIHQLKNGMEMENCVAMESMKTKMRDLRKEHMEEIGKVHRSQNDERQELLEKIEQLKVTHRSSASTPVQTDPEPEQTSLLELRENYMYTVQKIKDDVMGHVAQTNLRSKKWLKSTVQRERKAILSFLKQACLTVLREHLQQQNMSVPLSRAILQTVEEKLHTLGEQYEVIKSRSLKQQAANEKPSSDLSTNQISVSMPLTNHSISVNESPGERIVSMNASSANSSAELARRNQSANSSTNQRSACQSSANQSAALSSKSSKSRHSSSGRSNNQNKNSTVSSASVPVRKASGNRRPAQSSTNQNISDDKSANQSTSESNQSSPGESICRSRSALTSRTAPLTNYSENAGDDTESPREVATYHREAKHTPDSGQGTDSSKVSSRHQLLSRHEASTMSIEHFRDADQSNYNSLVTIFSGESEMSSRFHPLTSDTLASSCGGRASRRQGDMCEIFADNGSSSINRYGELAGTIINLDDESTDGVHYSKSMPSCPASVTFRRSSTPKEKIDCSYSFPSNENGDDIKQSTGLAAVVREKDVSGSYIDCHQSEETNLTNGSIPDSTFRPEYNQSRDNQRLNFSEEHVLNLSLSDKKGELFINSRANVTLDGQHKSAFTLVNSDNISDIPEFRTPKLATMIPNPYLVPPGQSVQADKDVRPHMRRELIGEETSVKVIDDGCPSEHPNEMTRVHFDEKLLQTNRDREQHDVFENIRESLHRLSVNGASDDALRRIDKDLIRNKNRGKENTSRISSTCLDISSQYLNIDEIANIDISEIVKRHLPQQYNPKPEKMQAGTSKAESLSSHCENGPPNVLGGPSSYSRDIAKKRGETASIGYAYSTQQNGRLKTRQNLLRNSRPFSAGSRDVPVKDRDYSHVGFSHGSRSQESLSDERLFTSQKPNTYKPEDDILTRRRHSPVGSPQDSSLVSRRQYNSNTMSSNNTSNNISTSRENLHRRQSKKVSPRNTSSADPDSFFCQREHVHHLVDFTSRETQMPSPAPLGKK